MIDIDRTIDALEREQMASDAFHLALNGHSAAIETGVDSDYQPRLVVDGVRQ